MTRTPLLSGRGAALLSAAVALSFAASPAVAQQQAAAAHRQLGVDTANFDRSVRPQDDFFRFINGGWYDRTEIPADQSGWGSFQELREKSQDAVREILEAAAAKPGKPGSESQKIGDLYASYMDTTTIEQVGLGALKPELARIAALKSSAELPALMAHLARLRVRGPFSMSVGQDAKNSDVYIVGLTQSGLGMPNRDYYLLEGAKFAATRQAYTDYITKLLTLANQPDPAGAASRIMALETHLATIQWDRVRNRDRDSTYNRMTVQQLAKLAPSFDWRAFLKDAGVGQAQEVVVRQPDYLQGLDSVFAATPAETWRDYFTFGLLNSYADELPSAYQQARFDFSGRTLAGQQEMPVRWKRAANEVQGALGEAVGKIYVERHFSPEAKARMDALVRNLLAAFKAGINELSWMTPATRAQAQDKLAHFTVKIGYPDKWRDYSGLKIVRNDLLGNAMRSNAFSYDYMVSRLGKPVDRSRWGMTPQTVNAYYNPSNNEIVFPAAILQPPFFNVDADDAVNYGGIGAVIGHEISHGFDDQGRKSDGEGNLRDWWTPADAKAFEARAEKLAAEYSAYMPVDSLHINGKATLGENIGDLSGMAVALRAYHMSLGGKPAPVIDGYTGDQRFFMGWAQVWRTKTREAALRRQLLTDPHSPGQYRAFVPETNLDAFYQAFDIKPGDGMYRAPEDRVTIW
ncbi:MAG TPA: M13 family metallopeptidase [Gemmatimonadales bacterium]|nr:M13 family metallopeptidase [Gemmatimonadales bacterium]